MPVRRSTHVRAPKPVPLSRPARIVVPVSADVALPVGHDAHSGVGFLRVNRRRLAILAAAISFLTIALHDLPASAATMKESVEVTAGQTLATGDAVAPVATRDAIEVVTYTPVQWPIDPASAVSSGFGFRISPCSGCSSDHQGVDFDPGSGTPIASIADGTVVEAGTESGGLGVHVVVQHDIDGQVVRSVYGHMISGSMAVSVGQTVTRGQLVGLVGSTGASTGAHLHFEIRPGGGDAVEPIAWLHTNATEPFSLAH
jgi:murein DD-endopeptidase MepM/ murein hydrolase activator NlpD